MATNEEIIIPKVLVVPTNTPAKDLTAAPIGSLVMSGAKLYVATAAGTFEKITST